MKKKYRQYLYPAIFLKDDELGGYQVIFPDLNIYTDGKNLSEAYLSAKELLRAYLSFAFKYETDFNLPTKLEALALKCKENETIMYVDAFVD